MSNSLENPQPEQAAVPDSAFCPTEMFAEVPKDQIDQSIPARFEKIVRMYPNRLALKMGDQALTYEELNRYANRISRAILEQRGPGSEPIALLFEHGIDAIAAIFAVLKAGKFFLALNPASPEERNARALADSGTPLVVTNARHQSLVETLGRRLVPSVNIENLGKNDPTNPVLHRPTADIAVLTYTSGSTGEPKGVVQTHRHLLHSFRIQTDEMRITIDDRVSLLHSLSFATAYSNLLAGLLNGAALFPLDMKTAAHSELTRWVGGQKITVIHLPPTSFREFAESFGANQPLHQLRLIRLSGAPITERDFKLYQTNFPAETLLNITMGSTELRGICSAVLDRNYVFPTDGAPVGYARPGKQVLILDEFGREVEIGQVGEIAVRSKHADGEYWQPSMRGKKPIQLATDMDEERLYLTGDLGKKLDDGFVIHLGRKDFMVKIRGYRVDLSEIERTLLAHPQLIAAAVVAWDRESEDKPLTAYVVALESNAPTVNQLRRFLSEKLADYMMPRAFVFLQSLPLTNGKLDRTALPRPDHQRPNLEQTYVPPRDEFEIELVRIWTEVLGIDTVGLHDNFFDLGGHSLAASRVISRVIQTFQLELPIKALFDAPTVAEMAKVILQHQAEKAGEEKLASMLREMEAMPEDEAQKQLAGDTTRRPKGDGHE